MKQKQIDSSYYFEVKETGAKLSMREAKLLIESFCALFIDREIKKEDFTDSSVNTTMNQSVASGPSDSQQVTSLRAGVDAASAPGVDGDDSKTSSSTNN